MTRGQARSVLTRDDYILKKLHMAGSFSGAETDEARSGDSPGGSGTPAPPSYSCHVKRYGSVVVPVFSFREIFRYGYRS